MINYNFFGKDCVLDQDLKDRTDLNQKLNDLNFKFGEVLLLNQVHGDKVVLIDDIKKIHGTQNLPKADGIVTNLKNVAIGIVTADCAPIIFYDEEKQVIGACHAGWKGAKLGIIQETVKKMHELGATNICAIIGPMIQQQSYEISLEFYNDFIEENIDNKKYFMTIGNSSKMLFNLCKYVEDKLVRNEILSIENSAIDTYSNEQNYFSYRRSNHHNQTDCGRNISVIAIN